MYNAIFGEYALNTLMSKYDFESCVSHVKIAEFGTHWLQMAVGSRYYNKVYAYRQEQKEAQVYKKNVIQALAKQINWDVVKEKQQIPNKLIKLVWSQDKTHFTTSQGKFYYPIRDDQPLPPDLNLVQCGVYSGHYPILKDKNTGKKYIYMPPEDIELFQLNTVLHCEHLKKYKNQNINTIINDDIIDGNVPQPFPAQNWFVENGV